MAFEERSRKYFHPGEYFFFAQIPGSDLYEVKIRLPEASDTLGHILMCMKAGTLYSPLGENFPKCF